MASSVSSSALLTQLASSNHPQRLRMLAHTKADVAAVSSSWLQMGEPFAAQMAMLLAGAHRLRSVLLRGLEHPHRSVSHSALRMMAHDVPTWHEVMRASLQVSIEVRRQLWRMWSLHSRETLSRAQFDEAASKFGTRAVGRLLVRLASHDLAAVLDQYDGNVGGARCVVFRHAPVVVAHIRRALRPATDATRDAAWADMSSWFQWLAHAAPDEALRLLEEFPPVSVLRWRTLDLPVRADADVWGRLVSAHPALAEALRTTAAVPVRVATRLPVEVLCAWAAASTDDVIVPTLRRLPMWQRKHVLLEARAGALQSALLADELLDLAPRAMAADVARRQRSRPEVAANPLRAAALCKYMPYDEAAPILLAIATSSNEAGVRGLALQLMVRSAGRHRRADEVLHRALETLDRIRNEQDPVRGLVMQAWAQVPASRFTAACAPWLVKLANHIVDARDTSALTRSMLHLLASRVLTSALVERNEALVEAALAMMRKSAGADGVLSFSFRDVDIPVEAVPVLLTHMGPLVEAGLQRGRPDLLLSLVRALGRRAYGHEQLNKWLWDVVKSGKTHDAGAAAELLLQAPRTRDEFAHNLMHLDATHVMVCPTLQAHINHRRQDWLSPLLDIDVPLRGKFADKRSRWTWRLLDRLWWFSPEQQALMMKMTARVADDTKQYAWSRASAIAARACIPCASPADLSSWIASNDVVVVEAALHALSVLDDPSRSPAVLLDFMEGDRARVAAYSLARTLHACNPHASKQVLHTVLHKPAKLTARKEALRLAGSLRLEGAIDLVTPYLSATTHKDLRIAAGHALRQLLEDPRVIQLLSSLATSPDSDGPRSLLEAARTTIDPAHRKAYVQLLLQCAQHEDVRVRDVAYNVLPTWILNDAQGIVACLVRGILNLNDFAWGQAARAFAQVVAIDTPHMLQLAALATMTSGPQRDEVGLQRLNHVVDAIAAVPREQRMMAQFRLRALALALRPHALVTDLSVRLELAAVDVQHPSAWREVAAALDDTIDMNSWHTWLRGVWSHELPTLAHAAQLSDGTTNEAFVALAMIERCQALQHPPDEVRELVHRLRAHTDARVRRAAHRVYLVLEPSSLTAAPL
jgi:hypothetical protein